MVSNYLIVIGKYLFFDKNASDSVPINYEIFGSKNIKNNMREIESDSINLSNEMFEIFENYNFSIDSFLDSSYENIVVFSSLRKKSSPKLYKLKNIRCLFLRILEKIRLFTIF